MTKPTAKASEAVDNLRRATLHTRPNPPGPGRQARSAAPDTAARAAGADVGERSGAEVVLAGLDVPEAGGKRVVFYLPPALLARLDELQAEAARRGGRLPKSLIVRRALERFLDEP